MEVEDRAMKIKVRYLESIENSSMKQHLPKWNSNNTVTIFTGKTRWSNSSLFSFVKC